jgi:hypothetical protein
MAMTIVRVPLLGILLSSIACATLQPLREPAQFIAKENPEVVYVTYKNRSVVGVARPRVSGDSLFGTVQGQPAPLAVPLSNVERIEAVRPDGKRTALLIAGLTAFTVTSIYVLLKTGNNPSCDGAYEHEEDYCPGVLPGM